MTKRRRIPKRDIERVRLPNGVTVLSERVKGAHAVALGVWVRGGSRYEDLKESGMTYLIQRLAFHGSAEHPAEKIAAEIDRLGGEFQIQTEREAAGYLGRVEVGKLADAVDLLTDLALHPRITQKALSVEEKRVLEELRNLEKDPDFVLERMFLRSFWKGHGLCRPPRGRLLTYKGQTKLESFKPKVLQRFHERTHFPSGLVFTAAGDLKHDQVFKLAERHFGGVADPKKTVSTNNATSYQFLALRNRSEGSQVRFQLGVPACPASDKERFAGGVLHSVLGAGADSRLARAMREGRLSASEANSVLDLFTDTGCLSVRARTSRKDAEQAITVVVEQLRELSSGPVSDDELDRAKATRRNALLDRIDSLRSRVLDLAQQERYFGGMFSWEEEFESIEAVTAKQVYSLATEWFTPYSVSLAVVGNLKGVTIGRRTLQW